VSGTLMLGKGSKTKDGHSVIELRRLDRCIHTKRHARLKVMGSPEANPTWIGSTSIKHINV
jgi:hypothetical protein